MAVYTSVSIKEVFAMFIGMTGLQDSTYLFFFEDWVGQAMGLMKTKFTLSNKWEDIIIDFHKGSLPCDFRVPKAVEFHGRRLERGNNVKTLGISGEDHNRRNKLGTTNGFEYVPQLYLAPDGEGYINTQDLVSLDATSCNGLPCMDGHWYDIELDYIITSIKQGKIRVHYRAIPVDEEGLPKIPDNEDYKMALYYYIRAMMIGRGYKDSVFTYDKLMDFNGGYFWQHANRAMSQIRYPSVDSMEFKVNEHTRLIKDENYFHNFFDSSVPERKYGYDEYLSNIGPAGAKTYPTP